MLELIVPMCHSRWNPSLFFLCSWTILLNVKWLRWLQKI